MKRVASVDELSSPRFRAFMAWVNTFAQAHGLRVHTNWSKVWEYPWAWQYLCGLPFMKIKILDIGSEISPMPWFFASLGADVSMLETDPSHISKWVRIKEEHPFEVDWKLVNGQVIPFPDGLFDVVTSFSVIEHIPDKQTALKEAVRVLKPGGLLCLTFDICESSLGMTFPEWNGTALDLETFDRLLWRRGDIQPLDPRAEWNVEDMEPFRQWNLQSASHHNYVVGGAVFRKIERSPEPAIHSGPGRFLAHQLDTGLGSGNTGDDAMFLGAYPRLSRSFLLTTEVHSLERTSVLPPDVRYLRVDDQEAIANSIGKAELVLISGDTPVMDEWGLQWPMQALAGKLLLCDQLRKPVHAVGVGVDRLKNPDALRIFHECYAPIRSWAVRSVDCKLALLEMGVPEERILVGADWAWLLRPEVDAQWAEQWLRKCGAEEGRIRIGVNLVNEIWQDDQEIKSAWAATLDRLVENCDAQIVFFCNESRSGGYFDKAAAEAVQSRMQHAAVILPNVYYTAAQMISLLSRMRVAISQRYHFTLFSVLADTYPISIARGQKMRGLNEELSLPYVGDMLNILDESIEREIRQALEDPETKLTPLRLCRRHLERRATNNLSLVEYSIADEPLDSGPYAK